MDEVDPIICAIDANKQLRVFIKNKIRLDGRSFDDYRHFQCKANTITSPGVIGSSHVQMGSTVVFCGINLMIGVPSVQHASSGDIGKID